MMRSYQIEVETTGRELYEVDAESPDEALANYADGTMILSEVTSVESKRIFRVYDEHGNEMPR